MVLHVLLGVLALELVVLAYWLRRLWLVWCELRDLRRREQELAVELADLRRWADRPVRLLPRNQG